MKALIFNQLGDPLEVIELANVSVPEIAPTELLVQIAGSSIGPGDALFTQGRYPEPKRPKFPAQIAGNHAVGFVVKAGTETSLPVGTLVAFSHSATWAEYVTIPEANAIPLPSDYPIEKAAQITNIITAGDLLQQANLAHDEWLVVTSAGSSVAVILLQLAVYKGINVIGIVRDSSEHQERLVALGAKAVLSFRENGHDEANIADQILEITQNKGVKSVIDCAGGSLLSELINTINYQAKIIIYGGYSHKSFTLHNYDLLLKNASILTYNYRFLARNPTSEERVELIERFKVVQSPDFYAPVAQTFTLDEYKEALCKAFDEKKSGTKGKYIFKLM